METAKLTLGAVEAAKALGICQRTLWDNTYPRGTIRCVRIGRRVLYPIAELQAWLAEQCKSREAADAM